MGRVIQLRDVPDHLHRRLKARAAREGLSLSEYLLREIRKVAERPTMAEMLERLARLEPINPRDPPAKVVREGRDGR
jgi:plasmid stability protein